MNVKPSVEEVCFQHVPADAFCVLARQVKLELVDLFLPKHDAESVSCHNVDKFIPQKVFHPAAGGGSIVDLKVLFVISQPLGHYLAKEGGN